ncbi:MAG: hypothetical protein V1809_13985, partial [Planctomycetota bacterium]
LTKGRFILDASETLDINGTGTSLSIANDTEAWLDVTGAGVSTTCEGSVSVGTNGQMDLDGGLLKLDGSTATTITLATPGAQRDLQNVEIAKTGAGGVTATGSLIIKGNFTVSDGTFTFGANTLNVAGNFTNSAAGAEGFDASNASATLVLDGTGTQQITSGGDALNIVTCSGSGTVQMMDAMAVGTGIGAGDSLTVTSGAFRLNGQTLSIKPGTRFLFSSSTAGPNGFLRSTVAGSAITRSGGAGTFTFTFEEGQLDISILAFSYADADGFNIAPAAGGNGVQVLTFDNVTFTGGTTRHMTIDDGPGLVLTDATWENCSFDGTVASNIRTLDNSTQNTSPTTVIVLLNASGAKAGEDFDDDVGTNRITIDWLVSVNLQGSFDGSTDVSWARNGTFQATYTTNSSPFTFAGASITQGDLITVWYEGGAVKGALVTTATGGNMTTLNLTANRLIVRNDNGGAGLSNANLDTAHPNDADIPYANGGGTTLTVDANMDLEVRTGSTYTPGGTVTLQEAGGDLFVAGTMTLGGALAVPGTATVSGILSLTGQNATIGVLSNTGTVRLQGNEAVVTITTMDTVSGTVEYTGDGGGTSETYGIRDFGATDYFNLAINDVNATKDSFAVGGTLTVAGTLTVDKGVLDTGANTLVLSGAAKTHRVKTGGELRMSGAGAIQVADTGIVQTDYDAATPGIFKSTNASATVTKTGAGAGGFAFRVYGTADITGLTFGYAGLEGLEIGDGTNQPTLTNLSNVTFQNHPGGSGKFLTARVNGPFEFNPANVNFAAITSGYNVQLADNDGVTDGNEILTMTFQEREMGAGAGESKDLDNDTNDDGMANAGGDAVISWVYTAQRLPTSTSSSIEGYAESAYDDGGVWYATYVTYKNITGAGTTDRIYIRDANGDAAAGYATPYFDIPQGDGDIVGAPWWDQEDEAVYGDVNGNGVATDGSINVVYVATSGGKIYKLIDTGTTFDVPGAANPWNTAFENAAVTGITSGLISNKTNLYFGGTTAGADPRIFSIQISNKTLAKNIDGPPSTIATVPALRNISGDIYLFVGSNANAGQAHIYRVDVTGGVIQADNITPLHDVKNPLTIAGFGAGRLYVGDDGGRMHAIDAGDFAAPEFANIAGFPYRDENVGRHAAAPGTVPAITGWPFMDNATLKAYYGDADGHFYILDGAGALVGGYPIKPASVGYSRPDVFLGVITAGTEDGQLLFIDESTGTVFKRYRFGSGKKICDIGYDWASDMYVVGTDKGDLYYVAWESDPTP